MKVVILAGGLGTRLSEETVQRSKPMVEIGDRPILWHIMKIYSAHGINDFVVCLGYRGYQIKEFFANYFLHTCDVTFDIARNEIEVHQSTAEPWRVTLVETGEQTMTGGRIKRVLPYVEDEEFCLTYGDGLSDVDIGATIDFHREHGALCTLTAVQPPARWGALDIEQDNRIRGFMEKPEGDGGWVNGGFFVCSPGVGATIADDRTVWEQEPLMRMAGDGRLAAYKHTGFWYAMDTLRDKLHLEELWSSANPPWRAW